METTEIDVLKARAAASQSTATHWRKQCERAEAKVRALEGLLVKAGRRVQEAERKLNEAMPVPARKSCDGATHLQAGEQRGG